MRTNQINISPRAYAALLASALRSVLAQDAKPILASDIEPLLRGGFRRHEIERALARKLKGRLASDTANPEDVASKLVGMLHEPERETTMTTSKDRSPMRRKSARDGIDAELQKALRRKLDAREFEAVMAALGGGNSENDEPSEESDYARQQFSAAPPSDPDDDDDNNVSSGQEDMGGTVTVAKPGDFDDDDTADDDPPAFGGQPLVGGKLRPLSTKPSRNPTPDCQSQAMDESFAKRWPDAARLGPGESQRQYRNGVPVPDERLLGGSTPTPRRASAMDGAASVRSAKSFADRFPEVTRIRVEG